MNYFITYYDNFLFIFNYIDIIKITKTKIILKFELFNLEINGTNLKITKMTKKELKIGGYVSSLEFNYE